MLFKKLHSDKKARLGEVHLRNGSFQTPMFMPVGTRATVKTLWAEDLHEIDVPIILGNTYHLYLRPGDDLIARAGGLHKFMSWDKNILTDSGGFQIYSLSKLNKVKPEGVEFQSHIDGSRHFIGPKESMSIQKNLGSDIVMCFDECPSLPADTEKLRKSMELTLDWAKSCREYSLSDHQNLFGIVQGGLNLELRKECLERLDELNFEGMAIGGLSVGEKNEQMVELLENFAYLMPENKPRYLMGVGTPLDILNAVKAGVDMFDCVLPTRNARNGQLITRKGPIKCLEPSIWD